jgi:hypothetical protein
MDGISGALFELGAVTIGATGAALGCDVVVEALPVPPVGVVRCAIAADRRTQSIAREHATELVNSFIKHPLANTPGLPGNSTHL